jgi:hypothetical protein
MKVKNFTLEVILFLVFILICYFNAAFKTGLNIYIYLIILYVILLARNISYFNKFDTFFYLYITYIVFLAFLGALNSNYEIYYYYDVIAFLCIIFTMIPFRFNNEFFFTKYLPQLGIYINVIAIGFAFFHLIKHGINIASLAEGRGLDDIKEGQIMSPKYYLNASFFFYPLIIYLKNKNTSLIYHISIAMFIFFSLAMVSRGTTTAGIIIVILTHLRSRNTSLSFKTIFSANTFKYIMYAVVGFIIAYQIPAVASATDFLIYRFESEEVGAGRTEEAWEIYNNFSFNELIIGKGLGAANTYWIFSDVPNGVNNAHYGWMFLILKGGVLFTVFIYTKVILSIVKFSRNSLLSPYGISLIGFLLLEYAHTNFNNFLNLSYMFIALSASTAITKKTYGN